MRRVLVVLLVACSHRTPQPAHAAEPAREPSCPPSLAAAYGTCDRAIAISCGYPEGNCYCEKPKTRDDDPRSTRDRVAPPTLPQWNCVMAGASPPAP